MNSLLKLAVFCVAASLALSGCANKPLNIPAGEQAYAIFPPGSEMPPLRDYQIGPSDTISITVFNEPDFTIGSVKVDVAGNLNFPLLGRVHAAGKSTQEFGTDLAYALKSGGYLVNPRVTVNVVDAVSQRITVDGEVNNPGIYPITGPTTLLDVIALSRGTTKIARLDEVAIFRVVDGRQMAAKFDLRAIRRGDAPNPALLGNDIVVVGFDRLSSAYRDFLTAVPAFALFTRLY